MLSDSKIIIKKAISNNKNWENSTPPQIWGMYKSQYILVFKISFFPYSFFFFFFSFLRPYLQHGGQIRAAAAGLHHSHSNTRSLTHLSEARDPSLILMDTSLVLNLLSHTGTPKIPLKHFFMFHIFLLNISHIKWAKSHITNRSEVRQQWLVFLSPSFKMEFPNSLNSNTFV